MDAPRIAWTVGLLLLTLGLFWLLRLGWKNRALRQSGLAAPPHPPTVPGDRLAPALTGVYVSTTSVEDWQDRIVVHGMGQRARGTLSLYNDGIMIDREAAEPIWIPMDTVIFIGTSAAIAGKVMGIPDGVVVVSWSWGAKDVSTGFRADDVDDQETWIDTANAVLDELTDDADAAAESAADPALDRGDEIVAADAEPAADEDKRVGRG